MLSVWSLQTRPNMQADKYVSGCNTFKVEINRITLLGGDVRSLAQIYWHTLQLYGYLEIRLTFPDMLTIELLSYCQTVLYSSLFRVMIKRNDFVPWSNILLS